MSIFRHVSAMLPEAVSYLNCMPGGVYVDGTLGGAGHAKAICGAIMPNGLLIGIDQDLDAIANAEKQLKSYATILRLFHGNFINLPKYLAQLNIDVVNGILLDLGLSQHQLESSGRGFSFKKDEPLDMRMDVRNVTCARDLINGLAEEQLARIFREYGEERWAKRIAHSVVDVRRKKTIHTSRQLAELISSVVPRGAAGHRKIHPATRVFMALRIAVNGELDRLKQFLGFALDYLEYQGRLVVLSFHSLEDRMVKQCFKQAAKGCSCPVNLPQCVCGGRPKVRILTKKVLRPTDREIAVNPMARSTRLRAVEKIEGAKG